MIQDDISLFDLEAIAESNFQDDQSWNVILQGYLTFWKRE